MPLIIDLIANGPINEKNLEVNKNNLDVRQISVILTNDIYDVVEIIDIDMNDENSDLKLEKLHYIFDKSDTVIAYKCVLKLNVLKQILFQKNIFESLDNKTQICIISITRDIVKKINRHGLMNPSLNDITMKLFNEQFIDVQDSKFTGLTIQRICKKLFDEGKLNIIKPSLMNKLSKSFKLLVPIRSLKILQLHSQTDKSLQLEP